MGIGALGRIVALLNTTEYDLDSRDPSLVTITADVVASSADERRRVEKKDEPPLGLAIPQTLVLRRTKSSLRFRKSET